ncbi:probable folate-biopterin transporter 7 [Impatiens glandulifera]|uniref:probable folate-biopterin transporter 7 n=1 Tax=Impatiens glandulifera TaxID=253017 RepID=UPI001FB0B156|nr:probable folate-biopterin transporter 7 [Impatiens glandulifera]XP_047311219.1 probable folate-biopterin transporter 7 [Impatiens glandulifera]
MDKKNSSNKINMKSKGGGEESTMMMRKVLLGLGFWVQGLRCFPWMGVNYYLKDNLRVDATTLQLLQNSANLPMVAKPVYGLISDSFYIAGQHRIPYIAFGAILQSLSWLAIAFYPSEASFSTITICLLLGNLGASIVEVANDAVVAETSQSSSGGLQSFVWMASSLGGVMGNLLGGIAIEKFSPKGMFVIFGLILGMQHLLTLFIRESYLNLPKGSSDMSIRKQFNELVSALKRPEISRSITWLAFSYGIIPSLAGTMFFYQSQHLGIDSSAIGISKVFGQVAMLLWGIVYNQRLRSWTPRRLITTIQCVMGIFVVSDYLFVKGIYRSLWVPDTVYVVLFSGLIEVLCFFKILPFTIVMAQLCPHGCEGSLMAFVMSTVALAFIVSGYFGVVLSSYVGVTAEDGFSKLPFALIIQSVCMFLPIYWSSCIPELPSKSKKKET